MSRTAQMADEVNRNAKDHSSGRCAQFVREAIEAVLDVKLQRTTHAKDYGPSLLQVGFKQVSNGGQLRPGDVRIIQPIEGHPSGHMQMYTSHGWQSDFKQRDQWPGPAYRTAKPDFTTYRLGD